MSVVRDELLKKCATEPSCWRCNGTGQISVDVGYIEDIGGPCYICSPKPKEPHVVPEPHRYNPNNCDVCGASLCPSEEYHECGRNTEYKRSY